MKRKDILERLKSKTLFTKTYIENNMRDRENIGNVCPGV
jgi:hypothetical protein